MYCSIIIPSYNNLPLILKCINSIQIHNSTLSYEIIIVDNASSNETLHYLNYLQKSSSIKFIFNSSNLGFAKACNQAAKISKGDYLIFLNNDTEVTNGWIEGLANCILTDRRIGVVGCKLLYPDYSIQHAGVAFSPVKAHHLYRHFHPEHPAVHKFRELQAVTAACMLVPRKLFLSLRGFDEAFINGFEDLDFCFRARSRGLKIMYTPESVVFHHESKTPGRHDHHALNARLFTSRWLPCVTHDLDEIYAQDGLQRLFDFENGFGSKWLADTNENPFWEQAKAKGSAGDYLEAEKLYLKALSFNPYDVRILSIAKEFADLYIHLGRFSDANSYLEAITKIHPSHSVIQKHSQIFKINSFNIAELYTQ